MPRNRGGNAVPTPVRRKKTGAQICVIQPVKNSAGVVVAKSVGLAAKSPKKSRLWSSAMTMMMRPRSRSIESMRGPRLTSVDIGAARLATMRERYADLRARGNSPDAAYSHWRGGPTS